MADPSQKITVRAGCLVEVQLVRQDGTCESLSFTLVEDHQADFESGFLGLSTPLARTLLGKMAGAQLPYHVGDLKSVRILSVQAAGPTGQAETAAAQRQAALARAVKHSDYVNAMIFAGAVNSKWGDYDIDKLDPSQWETGEKEPPDKR
jgi:hypothetical protein